MADSCPATPPTRIYKLPPPLPLLLLLPCVHVGCPVLQMAALAVLSFAVATYLVYMKFTGVLGGLLLGE